MKRLTLVVMTASCPWLNQRKLVSNDTQEIRQHPDSNAADCMAMHLNCEGELALADRIARRALKQSLGAAKSRTHVGLGATRQLAAIGRANA